MKTKTTTTKPRTVNWSTLAISSTIHKKIVKAANKKNVTIKDFVETHLAKILRN